MVKNLGDKYKKFKNEISLSKIMSSDEQKNLLTKPASDRMQVIIAKIAAAAKAGGIPSELLKKGSYTYEVKRGKGEKTSLKNMTRIEKISKKINKEYEEKNPEVEKFSKNVSFSVHFTKDFVDKLVTQPDKEVRALMVKQYITPELLSQGWTEDMLNKPTSSINFNHTPLISKRGSMPFIDCISRTLAEHFTKIRGLANDKSENQSDFVGWGKKEQKQQKIKPKQNDKKDLISQSSDAINDMVTGGERFDISRDENDNSSINGAPQKKLEDMTPDEQVEYLSALGLDSMLPPGLKRD